MQPEPGLLEHAVRSQRNPQTTRVTAPRLQSATTSPSSSRNHETNDFGRTERTRYETPDPSQDYFEPTRLIGQPHPPPNPEHINQLAEASTSSFIRTLKQNASHSQETPNTSSTSHISDVSPTATGDSREHPPTWGYSADNTESLERCAQAIANTIRLAAFYSDSYDRMIMP